MKSIFFIVIMLIIVSLLGYWAFFTIEPGDLHANRQKQKELEQKNQELLEEIEELKDEVASLKAKEVVEVPEEETDPKPTTTVVASAKYQTLINDLQKLIDDKIFMKEKSRGSRVGTVQTFLNLYNKTSKKVDNDYGAGTKADVIKFQKAVGLTADGEAGPSTFLKMIEWLRTQ